MINNISLIYTDGKNNHDYGKIFKKKASYYNVVATDNYDQQFRIRLKTTIYEYNNITYTPL